MCSSMAERFLGMEEIRVRFSTQAPICPRLWIRSLGFDPSSESSILSGGTTRPTMDGALGFYPKREGSIPSGRTNFATAEGSVSGLRNRKRVFDSLQWHQCSRGGIGIHAGFRYQCFGLGVRVPPTVLNGRCRQWRQTRFEPSGCASTGFDHSTFLQLMGV